jgi:oligoribonuclease
MSRKASLLWIDLEMTGLDSAEDRILEVAAIATDWDFREIDTYEAVVKVEPGLAERRMVGEFWEKFSEVRKALLAQNIEKGRSGQEIESELLKFIDKNFHARKPVYLAGNSVWNDRRFIMNEWEKLDKRLHYRMLDVSAWKIYFANKKHKKFVKPEGHRAIDDIQGSIEEMKWYASMIS